MVGRPAFKPRPRPLRLATVKEACAYGKIGRTVLYRYLKSGEISARKRGGKTLIDLDTIDTMNSKLPAYGETPTP